METRAIAGPRTFDFFVRTTTLSRKAMPEQIEGMAEQFAGLAISKV
jgi:hypothetical protein